MADSNYERFKKRYKKVGDIPVLAVPPPVPGPGGIGRYLTGRVVQEGVKAGRKLLAGEGTPKRASGPRTRKPPEAKKPKEPKAPKTPKKTNKRTEANDSGTFTSARRISDIKKSRGPFPPPAYRPNTLPATRGANALTKADNGGRALVRYRGPETPAVRQAGAPASGRQLAISGRGPNARIRPSGTTTRAGVSVGSGAALTAGGYYAAKEMQRRDKANAAANQGVDRSGKSDREQPPMPFRPRLPNYEGPKPVTKPDSKAAAFRALRQGRVKKVEARKVEKKTFRKPEKPLNAFERLKMQMYEKEGHGGRSLTMAGAKAQVLKERSYKFSDLFKKKR